MHPIDGKNMFVSTSIAPCKASISAVIRYLLAISSYNFANRLCPTAGSSLCCALIHYHSTRLAIEYHLIVRCHHTESIGYGKEREMRGSGIKHIFTENKLIMGQRQLSQQRGCNIMLRAIDVNAPRFSDSTAHHQQRYPVAFYRQIVDMFGISPKWSGTNTITVFFHWGSSRNCLTKSPAQLSV